MHQLLISWDKPILRPIPIWWPFSDSSWQYCPDTGRSTGAYIIYYQGVPIDHGTHVPVPVTYLLAISTYLEGSSSFLRVIFFLHISHIFGGVSKVVRKLFQSLQHKLSSLSCPTSSSIYAFSVGSLTVSSLICQSSFWGFLLVPQLPTIKGAPNLSQGLIWSILGNLLPAFFVSLLEKVSTGWLIVPKGSQFSWGFSKVLRGTTSRELCSFTSFFLFLVTYKVWVTCFSFLWRAFWFWCFPHVLWGGRNKIELI